MARSGRSGYSEVEELHRYCARLTGSVIDGEDVVQDTLAKAFVALKTLEAPPPMRAWLFRIAHNQDLDRLRSRAIRAAEPLEAAAETADSEAPIHWRSRCARKQSGQPCRDLSNFLPSSAAS
jgi:RNA polymerase sigma-70 factor (ECF subfamily)